MYAEICVVFVTIVEISCLRYNNNNVCTDLSWHRSWQLLDRGLNCGQVKEFLSTRVMGGENASLSEFPWMARLMYRSLDHGIVHAACGGSVISDRYILTAGHCCTLTTEKLLFVRLGEYDKNKIVDCNYRECSPPTVDILVEEIIPHYNQDSGEATVNDICLIRLSRKIIFNERIFPICLPLPCYLRNGYFNDALMTVAGWGRLDNEPYPTWPGVLQKITMTALETKECSKKRNSFIQPTQLCAGGQPGHDVCRGDSGGPLMLDVLVNGESRYYLIGIVSYGQTCSHLDHKLKPGVYTRVSSYIPWMLNNIHK